jgi:hypothetical protein
VFILAKLDFLVAVKDGLVFVVALDFTIQVVTGWNLTESV